MKKMDFKRKGKKEISLKQALHVYDKGEDTWWGVEEPEIEFDGSSINGREIWHSAEMMPEQVILSRIVIESLKQEKEEKKLEEKFDALFDF